MEFNLKLSGDDLNAILAALKGNTERIMGNLTAQAKVQAEQQMEAAKAADKKPEGPND